MDLAVQMQPCTSAVASYYCNHGPNPFSSCYSSVHKGIAIVENLKSSLSQIKVYIPQTFNTGAKI